MAQFIEFDGLILNEKGQLQNLGEIVWNKKGKFDHLWESEEYQHVLEDIYLDESRCRSCFEKDASEVIEEVHLIGGGTYEMKLCLTCFNNHSEDLEQVKAILKEKFFRGNYE